jgi:Icc-related predicted phosphoesterase
MKLLLSSDIHGNRDAYRWLVRTASDFDVPLVLAGDLLGCPDGFGSIEEAQRADAEYMFSLLADGGVRVYYIWGNDDFVEIPSPSEQVQFLHERRIDLGQWNLVGYQNSLPFVGGPHESTEEEIVADLAKLEPLADSNTVLVTHSPGHGVLDLGIMGIHAGSPAILAFVQKAGVRAHVHGHIHGSFGAQGCHFNVAAAARNRAVLLDLDTLESEVLHG